MYHHGTHVSQRYTCITMVHMYHHGTEVCPMSPLQVLQSDGGNYCASVNAATLALIDAGIPMKDYVCACSASFVGETPLMDINYTEESSATAQLIVSILPKSEHLVFVEMNSRLHEDQLSKVLDIAVKGCSDIYHILDRAVKEHLMEASIPLSSDT